MYEVLKRLFVGFMTSVPSLSVEEASDDITKYHVLDVREDWELSHGTIEPSIKIPMSFVSQKIDELPRDKPLLVVCRSGGRSAQVVSLLKSKGFDVFNLIGGINGWARFVDPSIKLY